MSKAPKERSKTLRVALVASTRANSLVERGLYAAKLLFEFRVVTAAGSPNKRRLCEERIVLVKAPSASKALKQAERQARADRMDYKNSDGSKVRFRFIGVLDLLHLGLECQPNEVWYNLSRRVLPMERRQQLLPERKNLHAVRFERETRTSK